ncbi:MAG: hypothetical protein ACRDYX_03400 [Egibacteraceae bacterium]
MFASFLDVRGGLLPADELELGRSWVGLARSLYEVTDVSPGEGVRLCDLRTGEPLDVTERLGSQDLVPGTLLYARVAPDGRSHQLLGGTITIKVTLRDRLMAFLDTKPGPEEVAAWFAATKAPPTLAAQEGEATVLCEARYLVADHEEAQAALAEVLEVVDDRFVEHVEVDGQTLVRGQVRWDDLSRALRPPLRDRDRCGAGSNAPRGALHAGGTAAGATVAWKMEPNGHQRLLPAALGYSIIAIFHRARGSRNRKAYACGSSFQPGCAAGCWSRSVSLRLRGCWSVSAIGWRPARDARLESVAICGERAGGCIATSAADGLLAALTPTSRPAQRTEQPPITR